MKILDKTGIKIEQKSAPFQSDMVNCHGLSISNRGTSNLIFHFVKDGGEVLLKPEESIEFTAVADAAFEDDYIDGRFELAEGVLEADSVNLATIIKYIGRYKDC